MFGLKMKSSMYAEFLEKSVSLTHRALTLIPILLLDSFYKRPNFDLKKTWLFVYLKRKRDFLWI